MKQGAKLTLAAVVLIVVALAVLSGCGGAAKALTGPDAGQPYSTTAYRTWPGTLPGCDSIRVHQVLEYLCTPVHDADGVTTWECADVASHFDTTFYCPADVDPGG